MNNHKLFFFICCFFACSIGHAQLASGPADTPEASTIQSPKSMMLGELEIKDMDINDVLKLLAVRSGLNIIAGKSITGRVTIFLQNVEVHEALTTILKANDLAYIEGHGVLQIMTAAEYEQATGHKFGENMENTIISLQSAKASGVAAVLNQIKSQAGKVIADDGSNSIIIEDVPQKMVQLLDYIKTVDIPIKTKVFNINYAKADELAKTIGPMLTKDIGSIEFDARSNTLVVVDIPPKINEISNLIAALDLDDKEVFIEAKIIQITLSDEYQMGINWEKLIFKTNNTKVNFSSSFPIPGGLTTGIGAASIGTLSNGSFNDVLQALDTFGKSRILSSPRLAVVNNQEASILIGTTTPYTTTTGVTNSIGTTNSEAVSFIDTGVKLHVTPTIHDDGFITMKIKPEISNEEIKPYTDSNGNTIPIVDTSEVQTTVRVKDGITIIIGGLMKDELINNKSKIPILGDLPFLGKAFGNEDRTMQKTEIVIFLTPHIINGDVRSDPEKYLNKALKNE